MKKISIFLLFLCLFGIKEVHSATITDQITSTFLGDYHYVYSDGKFGDFELFRRSSNQDIAYCIEPGVSRYKGDYTGYYGLSNAEFALKAGITTQQLEKISLLSYYGYGYKNHTTTDWAVATQAKIWEVLGKSFQFTSKNYSPNPWQYVINTPSNIEEKFKELNSLLDRHYTKPSFDWQTIMVPYGETYILEDTNGVLSEFEIKDSTNCTVRIEGNNLHITPKTKKSEGVIYLIKKNTDWNKDIILFHHDTGQDLLATGDVKSVESTIVFKAVTGKITIKKVDKDTKTCTSQGEASLEGAIYGLYKEDGSLIQSVQLENCEATVKDLVLGNYYVQEIKAPVGYKLDEKKYSFSITQENITQAQTILVEDEVFTTDLVIHKEYLSREGLLPEENAEFAIINKNTNEILYTFKTNELGEIHVTLPYGEYIIRQVSGLDNYYKSEDSFITVNEATPKETTIHLINEPYTSKVKVVKKDAITKKVISLENIYFKIYDIVQEQYICQAEDCIFKTNKNGEFTTENLFPSTYRLEEIQQDIDGYLWNEETITFTVDKNSPSLIELEFFNKPVKGKIELQKTNQKDEPLSNVVFTLYAKEDIFENGDIIYSKDEVIGNFLTNESGQIETDLLPLGEYYFVETNSLEGYVPLKEPIVVSLEFKDSFTEVVLEEITIVNNPIYKGQIVLTKTDNLGNPLENVGFTLYANEDILENGDIIYSKDEAIGNFLTNESGQIETDLLPLGQYYFVETNSLEGYISLKEPIVVSLEFKDSFTDIVLEEITVVNNPNYKGKIVLTKTDNLSNPLENVGFTLYANEDIFENGKVIYYQNERIGEFYTNKSGQIETDLLPLGKYYFVETNSLEGYVPLKDPIFVELKYKDKDSFLVIETVEIENEIFEVPNTYLDAIIYPTVYTFFKENEYEKKNKRLTFMRSM